MQCDEAGPPCGPCRHREIECDYVKSKYVHGTKIVEDLKPKPSPSPVSESKPEVTDLSKRLLELELMHQYSTTTYKSFCGAAEFEYETWQMQVPKDGLHHPFVLDGLMAFSAFQIADTQNRPNRDYYVTAGFEYYDRALESYRSELASFNPDNKQALFEFSVIAMLLCLVSPRMSNSIRQPQSMITNMLGHAKMVQGSGLLGQMNNVRENVLTRNFKPYAEVERDPLDPDTSSAIEKLNICNDEIYKRKSDQDMQSKLRNASLHATCQRAILLLEDFFCICQRPLNHGHSLAWLNISGQDFLEAIEAQNPIALLTLMHWGVLGKRCSQGIWWAHTLAESLVDEITEILMSEQNSTLKDSVLWAREQIGLRSDHC